MTDQPFTPVTIARPYEQIVTQVHEAIRNGQLRRGEKLPTEREFSERFGVSRSVVREAVKVLVAQGIVESRQGSGTFVVDTRDGFVSRTIMLEVPIEERAAEQLTELREALDVLAARSAALRRSASLASDIEEAAEATRQAAVLHDISAFIAGDAQFHTLIEQAADNVYVAIAGSSVRQAQSEMNQPYPLDQAAMAKAAEQHIAIAEAIARRESEAAERLMMEHVRFSGSELLRNLREHCDADATDDDADARGLKARAPAQRKGVSGAASGG